MIYKKLSHSRIIAIGFLVVISIGTMLLMLPVSSATGERTDFLTCLFTAVSASCVTGLVVVDTATWWSGFGQAVILLMIQVGGLGFMTMAAVFFLLIRRKMSVRERFIMAESINTAHIGGIQSLGLRVFKGTMLIEFIGAVLLSIRFIPEFGLSQGLWYSVFHSVSAFCNAGFDLMGIFTEYSSFTRYSDDALVSLTLTALITVGGIGFLVWADLAENKLNWKRYKLHTKIVLTTSFILVVGGAILFFLFERNRMNADMGLGEQILVSLFSAVTPRTAGFNTVDTAALSSGSKLLTMILMLIGGSSGSTAGGIKTTTFAVLFLVVVTGVRKNKCAYAFGRKLPDDSLGKATQVVFTNLMLAVCGALLIFMVQDLSLTEVMFETFSAIGTVGMSTGVTRALLPISRVVIIVLMYCGRVGSVSFAIALLENRSTPPITYPEESITIG